MDLEGGVQPRSKKSSWGWQKGTLLLAYQSFGVVYGDLCISPVYVYKNTFSGKLRLHEEDEEILGVLSLVFWSLTLIPLLKYIILVLGADDNGEGGTFALYSLMCRRSRMGLLNSLHAGHGSLSTYNKDEPCKESRSSLIIRGFFEKHYSLRVVLLLFVLMGTSMVIGDGVLTPTMSVLSAVSGLRIKFPELHENYTVLVACIVLVGLFALQHYGTHRVGFLFAPILISWLACIGGIGIYNLLKWNPSVVRALSPYYIYNFFRKAGKDGWSSLGGIVLCITGAEAMFADLGHFSKLSLRLGFTIVVYPCLVLAYMGEAAYLSKHREDLQSSFYKALPDRVFWPVLIIATLATAVGSQAIISATFSIISQCRALGCFPRIKVVHTSSHVHGQIYIPEVNWTLMSLCLAVTIGFRDTEMIGNAYGLAVILVMFATTCLMFLVITTVWNRSVVWAALFAAGFGSVELLYLSACLAKVPHGGWLPLLLSLATLLVMSAWHYGTAKKQEYELQNKVCLDHLLGLIGSGSMGLVRVPGVGFVYSDGGAGATGVPPMFAHFVTNFPAFHRVLVFVSLQTLTVPKVPPEERFLVGRIGRPEYRLFRCVVRYGYKEGRWDHFNFENQLLVKVVEFLRLQADGADGERSSSVSGEMSVIPAAPSQAVVDALASMGSCEISNDKGYSKKVRFEEMPAAAAAWRREETRSEVRELLEEREAGVSYMVGHTCVFAHESSSAVKKFAVNVVYGFLRRNSRRPAVVLGIPHTSLIEVGMAYRV
ncbi:probable potassium transporter 13 isoform X2 [Lolium perenne]|uniref:probable potassium transporter 13 isoform X2 n=1 Tax=Lolium perenne TaxID=4522 RepID=UPI0021F5F596|nr:probable potassium transporter 13 isoform X2 [Lolium perenne]